MSTLYVINGMHSIPFEEWFRLQYGPFELEPEPAPEPDPGPELCRFCGKHGDLVTCCSDAWHDEEWRCGCL